MALVDGTPVYRLVAKVKYSDNGVIKTGTRSLGPNNGVVDPEQTVELPDNIENAVVGLQSIITDTVVSCQIEATFPYTRDSGTWGTPGTISAAWADFDDVKLVNSYTDGEKTSKETIKRVATGASEEDLLKYGQYSARLADSTTAISGYYTGASVESAWTND